MAIKRPITPTGENDAVESVNSLLVMIQSISIPSIEGNGSDLINVPQAGDGHEGEPGPGPEPETEPEPKCELPSERQPEGEHSRGDLNAIDHEFERVLKIAADDLALTDDDDEEQEVEPRRAMRRLLMERNRRLLGTDDTNEKSSTSDTSQSSGARGNRNEAHYGFNDYLDPSCTEKYKLEGWTKSAQQRLFRELQQWRQSQPKGLSAAPCKESNMFYWMAYIDGPQNTPYEGGRFKLSIVLPPDYPFRPPTVRFVTPIYHSNVDKHGLICIDILDQQWSPALTIESILMSIISLLSDPNPNDSFRPDIGALYNSDREAHDLIARRWTESYAKPTSKDKKRHTKEQEKHLANVLQDNKAEENKSEENKPEENKSEENKPEENKSEENKPEENKSEDNKAEDNKADDNKAEDNKAEENKPEENKSGDNKPEEKDE